MYVRLTSVKSAKMLPSTHLESTQASECPHKFPKQSGSHKNATLSQGSSMATLKPFLPPVLCVLQRTILKADHGKMLHRGIPGPLQLPCTSHLILSSLDRASAPAWLIPYSSSGVFLDAPGQHPYSVAFLIVWLFISTLICVFYSHQLFQNFPGNQFFSFLII